MFSQSERVLSFHSDIVVDTLSSITVKETIKIYANGTIFKRRITRTIPAQSVAPSGKKVTLDFEILSVEREGRTSKYHTETGHSGITIYVGERDVFLSEGEYGKIRHWKNDLGERHSHPEY